MALRIAINGFGRIGRAFVRESWDNPELELVAINDLGSLENLAYLLKFDTVYKRAPFSVEAKPGAAGEAGAPAQPGTMVINGKDVAFLSQKDPATLPWKDMAVDVVIECTGIFDDYVKAAAHITAGARRVVISAPVKNDEGGATILMGVNEDKLNTCQVTSNASCTTNSASPVIAIMNESLGIQHAILNTTHSYTATQLIVDGPVKGSDMRRGRTAGQNIVPSTTGAAVAVTKAYPELIGKFDGVSLRVPTPAGSIADITFVSKRPTTVEEVNDILRKAAKEPRWAGVFDASDEQLVSSDIIGQRFASIADLQMTKVVDGVLVKILAWYDNEAGYTWTLIQHAIKAGNA